MKLATACKHTNEKHYCKGLCRKCYGKFYYKQCLNIGDYNKNRYAKHTETFKIRANDYYKKAGHRKQLKKYGLTEEQEQLILSCQGHKCAICGASSPGKKKRHWSVDHKHGCCINERACPKCVRGLLCGNCNSALGLFKDNIDTLKAAIGYLERFLDKEKPDDKV